MNKEQYQALLDKLYNQVYKELKKKMFPRKHIKLLYKDIDITAKELKDPVIGEYETEKIGKYNFKHHIYISKRIIDAHIYNTWCKRHYKKRLKDTIAHELIHAYVYERHEGLCDIEGIHMDASPIFLGILAYFDLSNGHKSWKAFTRTNLYKRIKMCDTYEEAENLLIMSMLQHDRAIRELKHIVDNSNKTIYSNSYSFGNGSITGIKGKSTLAFNEEGYLCKASIFNIGPCVDLSRLKQLTMKKIHSNSFEYKYHGKYQCQTIEDKKNKLHLQTMNI